MSGFLLNRRYLSPIFLYTLMISLGVLSGLSDLSFFHALGSVIAELFIRLFKCLSLPIITLSIIVTLAKESQKGKEGLLWRLAISYTLGTTFFAALLSCLLYLLIQPISISLDLGEHFASAAKEYSYFSYISQLVPDSILAPFIKQQVISVLLLGLVIGLAIRFLPDKKAQTTLRDFFSALHALFTLITSWVIAIIPLGLFGFISNSVMELRHGAALKGLAAYLLVIVLANLIQGLIILPLWLRFNKIKPFTAMKAMLPALSVAFFSKSSVGTLPLTMETAEKRLGIKPEISRFVFPLCTSLNMNGCAAFIFVTVVYLLQCNGVELSLPMLLAWTLIASLAAVGNAGVPMGCFFLSASLLSGMNVSIALLVGLILPFYGLIDMLETALNVWSDACVAKVVDEKAGDERLYAGKSVEALEV